MKADRYILFVVLILLSGPVVSLTSIWGNKRHVPVQIRQEHGAVLINAQKVRVPFKVQETAIATDTDGIIEFLFLNDYQACLITVLTQVVMSLLLIFLFIIPFAPDSLKKYTSLVLAFLSFTIILFLVSEFCSHQVTTAWIADSTHGLNGSANLFGINSTFSNGQYALNVDYKPTTGLYVIPLIAFAVTFIARRKRTGQEAEVV